MYHYVIVYCNDYTVYMYYDHKEYKMYVLIFFSGMDASLPRYIVVEEDF